MAERQFGPYRLVRQIAVGGMAEIHLAKTKGIAGFEKYVALKMIHPNFAEDDQFIQMLVDEAKIAVQLNHGNIAQTFDLGRVGETYYITMEYVDGSDLYKILRRASEIDQEMPLDTCAFIGKEIASALDHAHRKRDNFGKNLGIVHRDVSPQNVLVSYAGEVKLVDFGIAKATMKARQTAVGVIKGKYYYMSPEQAWGDPIDYRSDIFSAGIVIYEMITGQMLYLEEDLHKLLDMARKADIAPPSKLRKGVPPQLERIVMHALAKQPGERYQSAGDLASDLERFLHTYSPVFTAGKIAALLKQVIGDPMQVPNDPGFPSVEVRDGVMSTHELSADELIVRDEIRDENSVIFRVEELKPKGTVPIIPAEPPTPPIRVSDQTAKIGKIPSISPPRAAQPAKKPAPQRQSRPRQLDEETRQLGSAPPDPDRKDDSGLLDFPKPGRASAWDATSTFPGDHEDLENVGERTIVTAPGGGGYMMDVGGEDGNIEATLITGAPQPSDTDVGIESPFETDKTAESDRTRDDDDDEDGPTLSRDVAPVRVATRGNKAPAPPALAAKIHAPAVSELRKPKPSRRTPPGGIPVQGASVLQAIVGSQASEPMPTPVPRNEPPPVPQPPQLPYGSQQQPPLMPPQFPSATPGGQPSYMNDASGLPLGVPTPPTGMPVAPMTPQPLPGAPPHMQPYMQMQGMAPGYPQYPQAAYPVIPGYPIVPQQQQQQHVTPGALYQFSPYGAQPQAMSLTGQMRLFEADELPSAYNLGAARRRWFGYIFAGILAVSVAAAATFFIIRSTRDNDVATCSVRIVTVPDHAEVLFDGTRLSKQTPFTVDNVPCGSRHDLKIELAMHKTKQFMLDVPSQAGETTVTQTLDPVTGTIRVVTRPDGAEIRINDQIRGRSSTTVKDVDINTAKKIELRLKDYQPEIRDLKFNAEGVADVDVTFRK